MHCLYHQMETKVLLISQYGLSLHFSIQLLLRFHEAVTIMQLLPAWKYHNNTYGGQGLQDRVYEVDIYGLKNKETQTDWLTGWPLICVIID